MKLNDIIKWLQDHKTDIYAGIGAGCTVASPFVAVRAAKKIDKARDDAKQELGVTELTPKQEFQATAKYYILPTACTGAALGFNLAAHGCDKKAVRESAALATISSAAAEYAQNTLRTYSQEVIKELGPEKAKEIHDKATEAHVEELVKSLDNNFVLQQWFVEPTLGQPIYCTRNDILSAINETNHMIEEAGNASLSDWYENLRFGDRAYGSMADELFWTREKGYLETREGYVFPKYSIKSITLPDGYVVVAQVINFINSKTSDDYIPEKCEIYD